MVKNLSANAGDAGDSGSISGSGRSLGVGNGNPLQYAFLENSVDWGDWWATVHGVAKNWTWLSRHTCTHEGTHPVKTEANREKRAERLRRQRVEWCYLEANQCQGLPSSNRRMEEARKNFPLQPLEVVWPCQHLELLVSRTTKWHMSVVWSHLVGNSLWQS